MNKPAIRFNFDGILIKDSLSKIAQIYQPQTIDTNKLVKNGKYPVYGANGIIGYANEYNHITEQICLSCRGNCGTINLSKPYSWINGNAMVINVDSYEEVINKEYLKNFLSNKNYDSLITGGAQPQITRTPCQNIEVVYPKNILEQEKIASFLSNIDSLIEEKKNELEKTKQYKESMLYKMFPKEGSKVPEIRFKGFEGEWVKTNPSKCCSFYKGRGYSKNDLAPKGTQLFLYGRLYTKYENSVSSIDTFVLNPSKDSIYSKGNEVVIPASGETAEDISRATAILAPGIILGGDLNIVVPDNYIINSFLSLIITNTGFHYELSKKAQGKTVVHIHNEDLMDINFLYPKREEQEKIVLFFNELDNKISLQEKEITILENYKATLLEKMFA